MLTQPHLQPQGLGQGWAVAGPARCKQFLFIPTPASPAVLLATSQAFPAGGRGSGGGWGGLSSWAEMPETQPQGSTEAQGLDLLIYL